MTMTAAGPIRRPAAVRSVRAAVRSVRLVDPELLGAEAAKWAGNSQVLDSLRQSLLGTLVP